LAGSVGFVSLFHVDCSCFDEFLDVASYAAYAHVAVLGEGAVAGPCWAVPARHISEAGVYSYGSGGEFFVSYYPPRDHSKRRHFVFKLGFGHASTISEANQNATRHSRKFAVRYSAI